LAFYNITSNDEFSGATVIFPDGSTQIIASDNKNYPEVLAGLLDGSLSDDELLDLIAPFEAIYKTLTRLSERITRKGMKLFFDGDVVTHALANHVIAVMDGGAPDREVQAWLKFWEKAASNPSLTSQDELFIFIDRNGLSITPDGDAILYKGVTNEYKSTKRGPGIVDGVEFENDFLPNKIGSVVEIARSQVDGNRGVACSVGLHVGAHSYASSFASVLLTVLVNPRDVVSVPFDHSDTKIRVCRYRIVEETPGRKKYEETVVDLEGAAAVEAPAEDTVSVTLTDIDPAEDAQKTVVDSAIQKAAAGGSRVEEYKAVIRDLIKKDPKENLKRYRSKRITAGRRDEFTQAANELGYKL
jgi:hypothetical protein